MGHAAVDQARLFATRDDFDRLAERGLRTQQEGIAVLGLAQGLGGHRADLRRCQALRAVQALGKALQASQAAFAGFVGEQAVAVETGAQAHAFLQVIDAPIDAAEHLADLKAETVGADVDGGERRVGGRQGKRHGRHCGGWRRLQAPGLGRNACLTMAACD